MRPSPAALDPSFRAAALAASGMTPFIPIPPATPQSVLHLAGGLVDVQGDGERFRTAAVPAAANRRGAEIIEPDRHPHVGIGRANAVRRIEPRPAELGNEGLRPGVPRLLQHQPVGAPDIAAGRARRTAQRSRAPDEDAGLALPAAPPERESL